MATKGKKNLAALILILIVGNIMVATGANAKEKDIEHRRNALEKLQENIFAKSQTSEVS